MSYHHNTNSVSKYVSSVLLLLLIALWEDLLFGQQVPDNRFEYKYSIKGPNLSQDNGSLNFWTLGGSATASEEIVLVTPNKKSQKGSIWSKSKTSFDWWQIELIFRVNGADRFGGDGFAFWYTEEPLAEGPVFGSADSWKGLALIFDSYDNDRQGNNPFIMAIVNNGSISYDPSIDGINQSVAGCLRDYRNKQFPTRVKIEYHKNFLKVDYHSGESNSVDIYDNCFKLENVILPQFGYFGVSAATGDLADNHEVLKLLTHSIVVPSTQDKSTDTEDLSEESSKSADKVVNDNEFSKIFGSNQTEKSEDKKSSQFSPTKPSLDTLVSSSMSEDSSEASTMTPTREILTIFDGTTLYDDEIDASPAIKPEPTTATKTPTISIRKDIPEMKTEKVVNPDVSSSTSTENNNESESDKSSQVTSSATDTSAETVEESSEKATILNGIVEEVNSSDEHNLNDKQNESSENNIETKDTFVEQNESSGTAPETSQTQPTENISSENKDNISVTSTDDKTQTLPEDSKNRQINDELKNNKIDELDKNEGNSSSDSDEDKVESVAQTEDNSSSSENLANPSDESSIDAPKEETSTQNNINTSVNASEQTNDEVVDTVAASESVVASVEPPISKEQVADDDKTAVVEDPAKVKDEHSDDKSVGESDSTANSSSNEEPSKDLPLDETNVESKEPEETDSDTLSTESSEPIQSSVSQNETTISNDNNTALDPKPVEVNYAQTSFANDVPVPLYSAFDASNQAFDSNEIKDFEPKVGETVLETKLEDPIVDDKMDIPEDFKEPFIDSEKLEPKVDAEKMLGWTDGMAVTNAISDIIPDEIEFILKEFHVSAQVVVITFIIAFNWCLMKILLSVFNSSRKETELRSNWE